VLDEVATDDKEAANKRAAEEAAARRATEEATVKRATEEIVSKRVVEERATEEAVTKKAGEERAAEESTTKAAAVKAIGAARGSSTPGQVPSVARAKRAAASSGSTPPAKRPYRGVWKPRFVQLSLPLFSFFFLFLWLHSLTTLFAQVLSLRRGGRYGHGYRRCGSQGGSRAGSC
jgi:hypothetical protein